MPDTYAVVIQNREGNDENLSVTGTVNGRQVAVVIRRAGLPKSAKAQEQAIASAMVDQYISLGTPEAHPDAIKIVRT